MFGNELESTFETHKSPFVSQLFIMRIYPLLFLFFGIYLQQNNLSAQAFPDSLQFSGIYPHLAYYNRSGECGTGAVVPWAGQLWVMTYAPHAAKGSDDKLYEISPRLQLTVHPESVGGTPANRLIHTESQQLFIGPYAINKDRQVRVIPYATAPGRYTAAARHLSESAEKIYIATMEKGFYEVDVNTLQTKELFPDGNSTWKGHGSWGNQPVAGIMPGAHGKGCYSGQGVLVYANNGESTKLSLEKPDIESGSLTEWDGRSWKVIRRNQFTDITGPGGIYGNQCPGTDPVWTIGWDHKSLILGVRDAGQWSFFRLPKASCSYDGAHGWNTEWPRIRNIGTGHTPDYLMTMHGMFWKFPETFSAGNTSGIRPRSAYLKVVGDFARWQDRIVFGCDDSAQNEFLNARTAKGGISGSGQSNSNLWFLSPGQLNELGPEVTTGSVWLREEIQAQEISEPFLFCGWENRAAWIKNEGEHPLTLTFEVDNEGNNHWTALRTVHVSPHSSLHIVFEAKEKGEWVRVKTDRASLITVSFTYSPEEKRNTVSNLIFTGLTTMDQKSQTTGLLYGLGNNRHALGLLSSCNSREQYYELGSDMKLQRKDDAETAAFIKDKMRIPSNVVSVEKGSVLIVDDKGRRWRLPLGNPEYNIPTTNGELRICREVATERDLFNCHGTFYELPAENADGYAKIRPIASHNFRIHDYASYRGLLVMTGISPGEKDDNPHIIISNDGQAAVWAGAIDDLWKLGKPTGHGGPWVDTEVKANIPSDPYLIYAYNDKELKMSHGSNHPVNFTIEVSPVGDDVWMEYKTFTVHPDEIVRYTFPKSFQARWIRFVTNEDTRATTWLDYGTKRLTILPIGDSITEGSEGHFESYLFPLWKKLYSAGYLVDFIGPRSTPTRIGPLRHFAFGGKNAEYLEERIDSIYRAYPADIVLLHSGHNHFNAEHPVPGILTAHRSMIRKIRAINPNVILFDAAVIPSGKLPKYDYILELNKGIRQLVKTEQSENVVFVDQTKSFDWKKHTIDDKVHPNAAGANQIAQVWFDAIRKHITPACDGYHPEIVTYKQAEPHALKLHIFQPSAPAANRPAILFFFGGGWRNGTPLQFYRECAYYASLGMVAVAADYRISSVNQTTPFESFDDAKDVMRWLREHATEYGIDPQRIAVAGASAGGQLAAALGTIPPRPEDELKTDYRPNLLVLYYPVVDNSSRGYATEDMKKRFMEISPLHNISVTTPPTLFILGTKDTHIPIETGKHFREEMSSKGVYCELHLIEGAGHPIFEYRKTLTENYYRIQQLTEAFLVKYGYLSVHSNISFSTTFISANAFLAPTEENCFNTF